VSDVSLSFVIDDEVDELEEETPLEKKFDTETEAYS